MLRFLGRGSAFNDEQNSAFFIDGSILVLLDCPMSAFHVLRKTGPDRLAGGQGIKEIIILVTHTHGDHVGGIPMLIHYAFYIWHLPVTVAAPSPEVKEDLHFYLDRLDGCSPEAYTLILSEELTRWEVRSIPTRHVPELEGRCFGYAFRAAGKRIIYTGDTCTLEPFLSAVEEEPAAEFYAEAASHPSPVHTGLADVKDRLIELTRQGTAVYLMHLDNEEAILKLIEGTPLRLAPLLRDQ